MNKSYKSVWNESTGTYVAASEVAKSRGKKSRNKKALVAAMLAAGVGFGTAVKSEAATPNSFAAGILGTNTSNSECISSADGAVVTTNSDCSAATQQAGIVSYNASGTAGAY
ncbi:MAG TPA: ESPR domain-containing protein, partial [Paraburkholderia sp.]|nr:ESPR domain-containing protein [Paraburkholderia sp.]